MFVKQVGGGHYGGTEFQHWDFVLQTGQDYLSSVATKYLCRWRDKGGISDVQKALSYVDKLALAHSTIKGFGPTTNRDKAHELWPRYLKTYPLEDFELRATHALIFWSSHSDLMLARGDICRIIAKEMFSWPEMAFVTSKMKPDGWQGFTFEGAKQDFCWHRCGVCRTQFKAPMDQPPMLYHSCPQIVGMPVVVQPGLGKTVVIGVDLGAKGGDQAVRFPPGWHGLSDENGYMTDEGHPTSAYVDQAHDDRMDDLSNRNE